MGYQLDCPHSAYANAHDKQKDTQRRKRDEVCTLYTHIAQTPKGGLHTYRTDLGIVPKQRTSARPEGKEDERQENCTLHTRFAHTPKRRTPYLPQGFRDGVQVREVDKKGRAVCADLKQRCGLAVGERFPLQLGTPSEGGGGGGGLN